MAIETGSNIHSEKVAIPVDYRDNGLTKGEDVIRACQGRKSDVFEKPMQMGDIPRVFFPGHNEATV